MQLKTTLLHSASLIALVGLAQLSTAQPFTGTYGTITNSAPPSVPAVGLGGVFMTTVGTFPSSAAPGWAGHSFKATMVLGGGIGSGTKGTAMLDFSTMPGKELPAGTYLHLGDIDSESDEEIDLRAYDKTGTRITVPWLASPTWHWGNPLGPKPSTAFNSGNGEYHFDGSFNQKTANSIALRTIMAVGRIEVLKAHENNAFGLSAPKAGGGRTIICCKGTKNVVEDPSFTATAPFKSDFGVNYSIYPNISLGHKRFKLSNGAQVAQIYPNWLVNDEETNDPYVGRFFICEPDPNWMVAWGQAVNLPKGEAALCFRLKVLGNGPVEVAFRVNGVQHSSKTFHTTSGANSWLEHSATHGNWGTGPVNIEIMVRGPQGSGLAIDNIVAQIKPNKTPVNLTNFTIAAVNMQASGDYNINATWAALSAQYRDTYYWEVENLTDGTKVSMPYASWWTGSHSANSMFTFPGYNGTNSLGSTSNPGVFSRGKKYRITYGLWSKCTTWTSQSWEIQFASNKQGAATPIIIKTDSIPKFPPMVPMPTRPGGPVRPR